MICAECKVECRRLGRLVEGRMLHGCPRCGRVYWRPEP